MFKPVEKGGNPMVPFFEHNMILHHIEDLIERGKVIEVDNKQWILNN